MYDALFKITLHAMLFMLASGSVNLWAEPLSLETAASPTNPCQDPPLDSIMAKATWHKPGMRLFVVGERVSTLTTFFIFEHEIIDADLLLIDTQDSCAQIKISLGRLSLPLPNPRPQHRDILELQIKDFGTTHVNSNAISLEETRYGDNLDLLLVYTTLETRRETTERYVIPIIIKDKKLLITGKKAQTGLGAMTPPDYHSSLKLEQHENNTHLVLTRYGTNPKDESHTRDGFYSRHGNTYVFERVLINTDSAGTLYENPPQGPSIITPPVNERDHLLLNNNPQKTKP